MGDYAVSADVIQWFGRSSALQLVVIDDTLLDSYIDAQEGRVNGAFVEMDYPTIPLTGTADIALLKRQVARAVAADILQEQYPYNSAFHPIENENLDIYKLRMEMHMKTADNLLKLAQTWASEWLAFITGIGDGDIEMPDAIPDGRTRYGVLMATLDMNISEPDD